MIELRCYMSGDYDRIAKRSHDVLYSDDNIETMTHDAMTAIDEHGEPIAICGVTILQPKVAGIWVVCSDSVRGKGLSVVKMGRHLCDTWALMYNIHRFQAVVSPESDENKKFATLCGFEYEGLMKKFTSDGLDMELYARVY